MQAYLREQKETETQRGKRRDKNNTNLWHPGYINATDVSGSRVPFYLMFPWAREFGVAYLGAPIRDGVLFNGLVMKQKNKIEK